VLARALGVTVAELRYRLGYGEYLAWRAFYNYEAWEAEPKKPQRR
jgi:hypothetical protein